MNEQKKRKKWTSAEKLRIVLAGMEPGVEISVLCRREGLHPTQYYTWKNQLVSSAGAVFGDRRSTKTEEQASATHAAELDRLRRVIAEITVKLSQARYRRRQFNLGIRRQILPLEATESATKSAIKKSHFPLKHLKC